jgi:hypothetical protein
MTDQQQITGAEPDNTKPERERIPVLWFDRRGCGPDHLAIELHPFAAERIGETEIDAHLGLRVRAAGLVIGGGPLVDGGFFLRREQVEQLHRGIGAWLGSPASALKWRREPPTADEARACPWWWVKWPDEPPVPLNLDCFDCSDWRKNAEYAPCFPPAPAERAP